MSPLALVLALLLASPPLAAAPASERPLEGEIPVTATSAEASRLFREGRGKAINWECAAAIARLQQALALEPDFPLALAWLGRCEAGPAGLAAAERALQLSANLPATERMSIEALAAEKRGDDELVRKLLRRLVDLAPNDWLAQFQLGVQSQYDHKSQATIVHLKRAVELNPGLAEAYDYLGYVFAAQGLGDEGIAAARKFIELRPDEANAHDSLGEVLMLLGRLQESEVEFNRALQMNPGFWMSSMGLAYARFYRGDLAGGHEAIARARKQPLAESEARAVTLVEAWALLGTGHGAEALAELDGLEREALAKKSPLGLCWARFERAEMLIELGRTDEAHAQVDAARGALAEAGVGAEQNRLRRSLLVLDARMGALEHKPAPAASAAAALAEELRRAPSNTDVRSAQHHAQGEAALAAHDANAAVEALSLCPDTEAICRRELALAQDEAHQPRAAEETRARIRALDLRDNLHRGEDPAALYVALRLRAP